MIIIAVSCFLIRITKNESKNRAILVLRHGIQFHINDVVCSFIRMTETGYLYVIIYQPFEVHIFKNIFCSKKLIKNKEIIIRTVLKRCCCHHGKVERHIQIVFHFIKLIAASS